MAILKQKRARIYKDFDLSFGKNSLSGDLNKKLDVNAVGEIVIKAPWATQSDAIQKNLKYLFKNYEPRCRVTDIRVKPLYDLNEYVVSVDFHIVGINEPQELEVRLERLR